MQKCHPRPTKSLRRLKLLIQQIHPHVQFGTGNRKCRWHAREYPKQGYEVILPPLPHEPLTPCKARWVWAGAVIFASAMCSLHFAKASAATMLQQKKNDSADVQRGGSNI
jgi:hypothetical protein